jgi:hypothetical protein
LGVGITSGGEVSGSVEVNLLLSGGEGRGEVGGLEVRVRGHSGGRGKGGAPARDPRPY